jgi:hypothetical protein
MNVKRTLQNRIRGWFPTEPYLINRRIKVDTEPKQPPLVIPTLSNTSATTNTAVSTIFWIFLSSFWILLLTSFDNSPSPVLQASVVLAGLAAGAVYGFMSTRREVRILSNNYQYKPNGKHVALLTILIVTLFISFFVVIVSVGSFAILHTVSNGLFLSVYPFGVSMFTIRYMWFSAFEKRENMRLIMSGGSIFVIPKAPDTVFNRSEFSTRDSIWKILGIRIKEWFLSQPQSKIGQITNLPANILKFTTYFLFAPLLGALLIYETAMLNAVGEIFITGLYICLSIYWLKEIHVLGDVYRGFLFISAIAATVIAGVLLWLTVVNFISYWIISIVAISVFTLLYGLGNLGQVRTRRILKVLSVCLAIIGLISLIFSLALVYHLEDRLTPVSHGEGILVTDFTLNRSIPDTQVPKNLTANDWVDIEIIVAHILHANGASSVDFQISNQSSSSSSTPQVYFSSNNITNWISKHWEAPQNGTYYFTLHYNYTVETVFDIAIGRSWSTNEMLPTKISNPLLADYITPTLLATSILLATSMTIPIQQIIKNRSRATS